MAVATAVIITVVAVIITAAAVIITVMMTAAAVMMTATAMAGKGFGWQHQRGHNSRGKSDLTKHFLYPPCSRIAENVTRLSQIHSKSR